MKKKFKVPVTWESYGTIEVEAKSKEDAIKIVKEDKGGELPLPPIGERYYVDDSFSLSSDNDYELKAMIEEIK